MRPLFAALIFSFVAVFLSSCAEQTEANRSEQQAGGAQPWNRPEKWEGGGMLGSQMQQGQ